MNPQKINELEQKIGNLLYRQTAIYNEIKQLENELAELKRQSNFSSVSTANTVKTPVEQPAERLVEKPTETLAEKATEKPVITAPTAPKQQISAPKINLPKQPSDLEKIIGESWINKIGILIVVIGVAIGAKYSIENELISPLTRIILGYLVGIGLLGFGIKLKPKFEGYSAVLVSGAISIFYFITYSTGFSFCDDADIHSFHRIYCDKIQPCGDCPHWAYRGLRCSIPSIIRLWKSGYFVQLYAHNQPWDFIYFYKKRLEIITLQRFLFHLDDIRLLVRRQIF